MIRTLALLAGTAGAVAGLDLAHKALEVSDRSSTVFVHSRSGLYVAVAAAASLAWAVMVVRVGSMSITVAGGVVLGGALGNLASIALWPSLSGVPDTIVAGGIAFSAADVAVAVGFVMLIPAMAIFALRNRERLFEQI